MLTPQARSTDTGEQSCLLQPLQATAEQLVYMSTCFVLVPDAVSLVMESQALMHLSDYLTLSRCIVCSQAHGDSVLSCREQKGVKVRIELGPRDAHKSQACLAISNKPGEVAKKASYQVISATPKLMRSGAGIIHRPRLEGCQMPILKHDARSHCRGVV